MFKEGDKVKCVPGREHLWPHDHKEGVIIDIDPNCAGNWFVNFVSYRWTIPGYALEKVESASEQTGIETSVSLDFHGVKVSITIKGKA